MNGESSIYDKLESMLQDGCSEPQNLPLKYLRNITNNFSEERLLDEGGFGAVYKGVLQNGKTIVVKKLNSSIPGVKDKQFENEASHLMRLKHPNVVILVGWCSETAEKIYVEYNGKYIWAEKSERLLCLEYMPKGDLRRYLSDAFCGLGWGTRYKIIEGICYGLHYLHEQCQPNAPIIHMDLKPANILLDNNMVPKIADFGLSRLFSAEKTWTRTISCNGTLGYMSPEYINRGLISTTSDIFSLGVIIIEVVTGRREYPDETETSSDEFVKTVVNNWTRRRVEIFFGAVSPEVDYQQIRRCIQIGLDCVKFDWSKRPTISQIIKTLHEPGNADFNNIKRGIPEQMDVDALPPSSQPANTVQAAQPAQAAGTSSGPDASPVDLIPQSLPNASTMPTLVPTARQCLTPDAITALDAAIASARRRAHAQTTSLHLIASLLAPVAAPLLRDALARARSAAYSPRLQLKALDLCFAVALDRLPSTPTSSASSCNDQHEPPVANSLTAAIKRSQANQRQNPDMFHFYHHRAASITSPIAVKVDLSHLVLAILDDPLVSRVFADAGFHSNEIKLAILRRMPPVPLHIRGIIGILARGRNPMLVGAEAASVAADFANTSPYRVLPVNDQTADLLAVAEAPSSGFIFSIGDLKDLVPNEDDQQDAARWVVGEVTHLLDTYRAAGVWVMGWSATYETYLAFLSKFPLVDKDWELQLLPITTAVRDAGHATGLVPPPAPATTVAALSMPATTSFMESFVPFEGFMCDTYKANSITANSCPQALRCQQCNDRYEQEVATIIRGSGITVEAHQEGLHSMLQNGSMMGPNNGFDSLKVSDDQMVLCTKILNLKKKWNDYCLELHQGHHLAWSHHKGNEP